MRKLKAVSATMLLCLGIVAATTSCSEEKEGPISPSAKSVAGIYGGDMTCSVMGNESTFEDVTFTVDATDDATVRVEVSSFGEPPMHVPGFAVADVKVSGTDGKYSLAATEFRGTTDTGRAYSGTMQGEFASNELTIRFNLQYGAMPMPMICTFTALKK